MNLLAGTTVSFNTGGTSKFSGNFLPQGNCASPVTITSSAATANLDFGTFPPDNRTNLNLKNIKYIGAASPLIINDGVDQGGNDIPLSIKINDGSFGKGRTLYWVKNSGNWSGCSNWATTTGGLNTVKAPTQYDDVFFDDKSFSSGGNTVTIDLSTNACNNIKWQNNAVNGNNINFLNGSILNVYGSMSLSNKIGSITDAGNGYVNFASSNGTPQTILTSTEVWPQVEFNGAAAANWTLSDPITVKRQFGVISGTINTGNQSITCNDFNAYQGSDLARTINFGTSLLTLTGSNATGPADIFDLQGNNINWNVSAGAKIQSINTIVNSYQEFWIGDKAKTIPDILFQSSGTNGPSDIDIHTGSTNNLITFNSITVSSTNNAQMYIVGNCPKVYNGNLSFADNLNSGAANQRRIQGSNTTANIFNGTVTFGNNCGYTFENNNIFNQDFTTGDNCNLTFTGSNNTTGDGTDVFQKNFTMGNNSTLNFNAQSANNSTTFNGKVNILSTADADDAVSFGITTTFNDQVDITAISNRVNSLSTVEFNLISGSTTFNNKAVNFNDASTNNVSDFRFSGSASQNTTSIVTFGSRTRGLFVGGNTSTAVGSLPIPGAGAYNFLGTLNANSTAEMDFINKSANTYNDVNLNIYSIFKFTSSANSQVTGNFKVNGSCTNYVNIASDISGILANVNFNKTQTWNGAIVDWINVVAGSQVVTVNNGTNNNNQIPGTTIVFISGGNKIMYWVGGHPNNQSGDNNWTNPQNWALDYNNVAQQKFGNGCYPDNTTTVVFRKESFSTGSNASVPAAKKKNAVLSREVFVDPGNITKFCNNMIWYDDVDANTAGNKPRIYNLPQPNADEIQVNGSLRFADNTHMINNFNGVFRFVSGKSEIIDLNGGYNLSANNSPSNSNITPFAGPIVFDQRTGLWTFNSDIIINAGNRGNMDLIFGNLYAVDSTNSPRNITLDGNWTVYYPKNNYLPDQARFNSDKGNVIFNGQNTNPSPQIIIAGAPVPSGLGYNFNDFYNLTINRQSVGSVNPGSSNFGNTSDVVLYSRFSVYTNDPANYTYLQSYNSGITINNKLDIISGNLWDRGFQIIGNNSGAIFHISNKGALHLGSVSANSGTNNDNPQTSLFPTNFKRLNIQLDQGSIVTYRANGNQDISTEPIYSNLYLANSNQCITFTNGLDVLNASCTKKRLVMPNTSPKSTISTLDVLDNLTIESGLLLADNGFQITGQTNRSTFTIQKGAALFLGSGAQTIAASYGDGTGYNPSSNINGTYTTTPFSTQFPLNFDDAKLSIDPQSVVVYHSSLPSGQDVRGLNTSPAQYGHLVLASPSGNTLIPKNLKAATTIKGNLIIEPNANFIDNGKQINGTSGQQFTMNYNIGFSLAGIFANQSPKSTGTISGGSAPMTVPTTNNPFNPSQTTTFGVVFNGYINIPTTGSYTFYTASDDGSNLYIDGNQVVNNDYYQGITQRQGTVFLSAGLHTINVSFFQGFGGYGLNVRWQGPSIPYADIPASVLLSQNKTPNSIDYVYYDGLALSGSNQTNLNATGIPKALTDLTQQAGTSALTINGLSQLVVGNSSTSTSFPTTYGVSDINFDLGTAVVYNGGANNQQVFGIINGTGNQKYASLILTNPASPTKTLSKSITTSSGNMYVRESLILNPNNNLIDNGTQIVGTIGKTFVMKNATLANDPVTNSGSIGTTGESRLTIGTAGTATTFPQNYTLTGPSDITFEPGTTIVYNAGILQQVAGVQGTNTNGSYSNLVLTNPVATATPPLALKTLQNNAITIRDIFTINPNNIFADGGYQVSGTSTKQFNMFSTAANQPKDLVTGSLIGTTGESRYVVGSDGTSTRFPLNYRFGSPSDINFDLGTTVVYNSKSTQKVQGLAGIGSTAYANLTLTNPDASAVAMVNKYLTANSVNATSTIRGTLIINPNNNFIDNGIQLAGAAGQKFYMFGATLAADPLKSPGGGTTGKTGTSQLSIGNNIISTNFPTGYLTDVNSASSNTDINFDNGTTVAYCSGLSTQNVQCLYNSNTNISLLNNYYNLVLIDSLNGPTSIKTLVNGSVGKSTRIRGDLTIGNNARFDVSPNNYSVFLQGNWIGTLGTPGSQFNAGIGTVTFEGGNTQNVTHNNSGGAIGTNPALETNQDFFKIVINKTLSSNIALNSLVGVSNDVTFTSGDIISGLLSGPAFTVTPTNLLIFRSGATATGANDNSHVIGAVRKIGNQDFIFPLGSGTVYRYDMVSNIISNSTCFVSQYYKASTKASGFPANLRQDPPLKRVSGVEFWMLNREVNAGGGNSDANVTLTWNDKPIIGTSGGVGDFTQLRVARWNGSMWRDMGGNINGGSSNSIGSVTSTFTTIWPTPGKVDQFSPFTLASTVVINPLPVTLVSFEATPVDGKVNLHWKTSAEQNTKNFVVERSSDGKNFLPVTSVNAKGNSSVDLNYYAVDENPFNGTSYYRLKIIDFDSEESYSKQVAVRIDGLDIDELVLYPNPFNQNDEVNLNIKYNTPYELTQVLDITGKNVQFKIVEKLDSKMGIQFYNKIAPGTYIAIMVREDGKQLKRIKFIVN